MTKYTIPFIVALILPFTTVVAQKNQPKTKTTKTAAVATTKTEKGALFFENTYLDIGSINDGDSPIKIVYKFKNIGKGLVTISDIKPDCNCSKASWPKKPIAFGEEGEVVLYFHPKGINGDVTKTLTLFSDGEPNITYLQLRANVEGKYSEIEKTFREQQGNLKFDSYQIRFDKIYTYGVDSAFRVAYNAGSKPINIKRIVSPKHILVTYDYPIISVDNRLTFKLVYNARIANDYGNKLDEVIIETDDINEPKKKFLVRANIAEDFSLLKPKEKANPPIFEAINPVQVIDTMNIKSTVTTTFYVTNKGKSPMYLRKVYATCGCTKIEYSPNTPIKKGKKAAIKVTYDSNYDYGWVEKQIYVITNTPDKTLNELTLKANVMLLHYP